MPDNLTRRVTLYWMLAISVIIMVLMLIQFMNNEGVWLMETQDSTHWWTTKVTRSLNVIQILLSAGALSIFLGLAYLYDRGVKYSEHIFFLLVAMMQMSTMEAQQFARTFPQGFWAPVIVAMAFTTLRWSAVVLVVQLIMMVSFWGFVGALTNAPPIIFGLSVFGGLATGRYLRDAEVKAALLNRKDDDTSIEQDTLPSPKPSSANVQTTLKTLHLKDTPEGKEFMAALNRRMEEQKGKD